MGTSSPSIPQTRTVRTERGALGEAATVYRLTFGSQPAMIVADQNTWLAAGMSLRLGVSTQPPLILAGSPVHADTETVDAVHAALAKHNVIPVAVGSGTINDLVKLASHRLGRPYMVVATAASMDGYTAFGASITHQGSKQTFDCPAPTALLADIDVLAAAPPAMSAAGYADLAAKIPAGADWIVADALDIEPINVRAWGCLQSFLKASLAAPEQLRNRDHHSIGRLMEGLVNSGLAMQITRNSRPASGADHQFSHLWDMEGHTHLGRPVPHGFKVGIGALASCHLYQQLLQMPLDRLDVDACCRRMPSPAENERMILDLHPPGPLRTKALEEMQAKSISSDQLRARLLRLRAVWPALREKLQGQLVAPSDLRQMLRAAGAPTHPSEIGISPEHMRVSYRRARTIRRRYTVLDLLEDVGCFDQLVDRAFLPGGIWTA